MLGSSYLNEIVTKRRLDNAGEILNRLRAKVKKSLHQDESENKDGMDMALYIIDKETLEVQFSGAYNPLYIIRNEEIMSDKFENKNIKITNFNNSTNKISLIELKANRQPIATYVKENDFCNTKFQLQKNDCLYTFSDGYIDQFGGEKGRKFMTKNFKKLLVEIFDKPMPEQKQIINQTFEDWRGGTEQIDDVVVVGVKI